MEYLESRKIIYHEVVIHSSNTHMSPPFCVQSTMEISIRYNYYVQGDLDLVGEIDMQTQIEYICIVKDLVLLKWSKE